MKKRLPILVSIPHCGVRVPREVRSRVSLSDRALSYYSDPASDLLYDMGDSVISCLRSEISRVVVDLNRPPYHLPPRYPDGVVKTRTSLGQPVWKDGWQPDLPCIHRLLLSHYFPYHAEIDRVLLAHKPSRRILAGLDCHTMVPVGLPGQPDEGKKRPLFCLSNNGDGTGNARPGALPTCPAGWILALRDSIREHFAGKGGVEINHPFHGGFIVNAHYWHTGVPWIQVEMNRAVYESARSSPDTGSIVDGERVEETRETLREVLAEWVRVLRACTP
ncbi:MAG: N-formylglutamate amidohydrolase [Methanolinea sp.]|nr:N-formylglutamate amidohydrolase [Methanolinea sp.]